MYNEYKNIQNIITQTKLILYMIKSIIGTFIAHKVEISLCLSKTKRNNL